VSSPVRFRNTIEQRLTFEQRLEPERTLARLEHEATVKYQRAIGALGEDKPNTFYKHVWHYIDRLHQRDALGGIPSAYWLKRRWRQLSDLYENPRLTDDRFAGGAAIVIHEWYRMLLLSEGTDPAEAEREATARTVVWSEPVGLALQEWKGWRT
jgi:hypothetical protein